VHLKNITKHFEKSQNGRKIQNGVKNLCFRILAPKSSVFNRFQKTFLHSKRLFILWKKLFEINPKWQFGSRWRHFLAKIALFQEGVPTVDSTFSKF
jgi:hypothetical protein